MMMAQSLKRTLTGNFIGSIIYTVAQVLLHLHHWIEEREV
jgi:hypothetical protein